MRHPLSLLTHEVPPLSLGKGRTVLLLQDLHRPFADIGEGWLARKANSLFVQREFSDYFDAIPTVVGNVVSLLKAARSVEIGVHHVRWAVADGAPSNLQAAMGWAWMANEPEADFLEPIRPMAGELSHVKPGWGATGSPTLVRHLRERNIESIIIGGLPLDYGIRQTCFELADLGFRVLLVSDATAAFTTAARIPTQRNLAHGGTKLRSTSEVLRLLHRIDDDPCV